LGNQNFGDFAIESYKREYLDSKYQIKYSTHKYLYFRQLVLYGVDQIQNFGYVSPYLFSTYEGVLTVFVCDSDSSIGEVLATVELAS
jgi:hypothetical protein